MSPHAFLIIKALHLIAMVCWFAGLFYLPRLFVYHAMSNDTLSQNRFAVMERKLYFGIMWPSFVATWLFGIWLISFNPSYYLQATWLQLKLICVVLLSIYHILCGYFRLRLLRKQTPPSHVFFRWFNEFPILILIAVCLLAVLRPLQG